MTFFDHLPNRGVFSTRVISKFQFSGYQKTFDFFNCFPWNFFTCRVFLHYMWSIFLKEIQKLRVLGHAVTSTKPWIWLYCENHHSTFSFSQAKSFCSTYLKFWEFVEQLSSFTVPKFRVDRNKTMVSKQDMVGSVFFLGHPVQSVHTLNKAGKTKAHN